MLGVRPEFILTQETYNEKDHASITDLSIAQQQGESWLTTVVTHAAYQSKDYGKQNFPMLFLTEGMGQVEKVDNFDYKYKVLGKVKKTSTIAASLYTGATGVGKNREEFILPFQDKHFANQQTLQAKGNVSVRVQGEPEYKNGRWEYRVQIWGDNNDFVPDDLLTRGAVWGAGVFKVPFEDSYGVESRSYQPGTGTNMTSLVRNSYKVKGNVGAKVMRYTINANGQKFEYIQDWQLFLADLTFKEQCELDLWTSTYGRGENGDFLMYDKKTGIGIPSGAGIDAQIYNRGTHSFLTYNKLVQMVRDVTFNITDANPNVEIWTGTGGMEDIDRVLKNESGLGFGSGFSVVDNDKLVSGGNSWDMVYGAYFKAFRHVDGAMVTFRKHPMFDNGIRGDISDRHPISGLPKSSHDLYILDMSTYDGEKNFKYTMEKGREYTEWEVSGAVTIKGAKQSSRAHDRDRAEIHGMKSQGVQIKVPGTCYKSECL